MVLIAVLAVLCIFALIGMKKGVIKIAVSLATMVITIAVTTFAAPVLSEYIRNNTKWDEKIEKSIYENVSRDGKSYGEDDEDIAGEGISAYIDDIEEKVAAISEKMNLPDSLTKSVSESVTSKLVENVEESATLTLKDIASKIFAAQMAAIIVNAVSYCIVFIALFIILKIITAVTGIISRLLHSIHTQHQTSTKIDTVHIEAGISLTRTVRCRCSNIVCRVNCLINLSLNTYCKSRD